MAVSREEEEDESAYIDFDQGKEPLESDGDNEEGSDEGYEGEVSESNDDDDSDADDADDMQARIDAEIARKGIENMKMDKLGNYILE
jgi:RIO kinase 2